MNKTLEGIIAYTLTPFNKADDSVNFTCLKQMIDRLVASGVHAISPLGSTGKSAYLNQD